MEVFAILKGTDTLNLKKLISSSPQIVQTILSYQNKFVEVIYTLALFVSILKILSISFVTNDSCTVVNHLIHHPKAWGSSPAAVIGTRRKKMLTKIYLVHSIEIGLEQAPFVFNFFFLI